MTFSGFPPKVRYTPVPNPLFGPLLEEIDDTAELKCTLRALWLLYQKKGYPRLITLKELLADQTLSRALKTPDGEVADRIKEAVGRAVKRGTLLYASVEMEGTREHVYLLNTEGDRRALKGIGQWNTRLKPLPEAEPWQGSQEKPNIFALYEDNIALLTPLIAEQLKEAEELYPPDWIEDAFREAVRHNKRNWSYIARILDRWNREGRDDGEDGEPWGHIKKTDPKEYLRL